MNRPCDCRVCRADRIVRAVGELVIWVAILYFGGHLIGHLIRLYLEANP